MRPTDGLRSDEAMPRTARASVAGSRYHVLNRGNRRAVVFHKPADYDAFVRALADVCERPETAAAVGGAGPTLW